jgi:hypothetical protein
MGRTLGSGAVRPVSDAFLLNMAEPSLAFVGTLVLSVYDTAGYETAATAKAVTVRGSKGEKMSPAQ